LLVRSSDPKILDLFVILAKGGRHKTLKIVVDTTADKLVEGMHIVLVQFEDVVYIKNKTATKEMIEHIKEYSENLGPQLIIQVELR